MEWQDEAIVLAVRRHAENDAIVSALTLEHGRHAGLVHGGAGKRAGPLLQPGNRLSAAWRARLAEQLGHYRVEPMQLFAGRLVHDPARLLALASACALLEDRCQSASRTRGSTPACCACSRLWYKTRTGLAETYVRFEFLLLSDLGFGLDLGTCAVTGTGDDLAFVSPRSGRAVSRGRRGRSRRGLLPLPGFLRGTARERRGAERRRDRGGAAAHGQFLAKHVFARPTGRCRRRERLADRLARGVSENGT
jgi:DNA repair protein RecO (recombination protein O)